MSISPIWNKPVELPRAEDGKFVCLDLSTVSSYPSSGHGKFAVLTYDVNSPYTIDPGTGSVVNTSLENNFQILSTNLSTSATLFNFLPAITKLEIYNTSNADTVYYMPSSTSYVNLTSKGIPVKKDSYFVIEREISDLTLGSSGVSTDVRIFGHYRS